MFRKAEPERVSGGVITGALEEVMCDSMELLQVINLVKESRSVMWVSDGSWSMHQMLMALLDITGPADVMISSYAMSETPARILAQLKNERIIKTLRVLLDDRVDTRAAGSLQVIMAIADEYALVKTHAKVTLLQNDHFNITVVGSANYTENKRYETGVIFTDMPAYEMQCKWISKAFADGRK